MANQHKVDFVLSAKDQGLTQTLSKAEREFLELGNRIRDLSRTQGDISAYTKQQAAIEKTQNKLQHLTRQHELLQQQIEEYKRAGQSTTALEREQDKLNERLENTTSALDAQNAKLEATGSRLEEAGVDTNNLAQESNRLETELRELSSEQEQVAETAAKAGEGMVSAFEAAGAALAAAGIIEGLKKIGEGFVECVQTAGNFEAAMANVEAVSGASSSEMDALNAAAKTFGATTAFSAQEAAEAMGYMGMAGWDAQQMISGMGGVLDLASASGESLANVSDIVTDSLTAFGMTAGDSSRMADVMAAASSNANTNVSMMGETFKNAAPVASALGFSLEDVALATGLMANSGIKASDAGTALRAWMTRMAKPTKESAAAMEALGISVTDSSGNMRSFSDIMDQTRSAMSGLSEAERTQYAAMLGGQNAMSGLLAVVNAAPAEYDKLTTAIENSAGAAQRMADIKLDTMQGQITILQSAWEGLQITIGEQFTPAVKNAASAGAEIISWANDFLSANPGVITGVSTFVGVAGTATAAIVGINSAIQVFKALNLASLFTGPIGPIMAAAGAIGLAVGAVTQIKQAARDSVDPMYSLTATSRAQYQAIQSLNAQYDVAVERYGATSIQAQELAWRIEDLSADFDANAQSLEEYNAHFDAVMSNYEAMNQRYAESSESMATQAESANVLINELDKLASSSGGVAEHQGQAEALISHINTLLPGLSLTYDDVANSTDGLSAAIRENAQAYNDGLQAQAKYAEYAERLSQRGVLRGALDDAKANAERLKAEKAAMEAAMREDYTNVSNGQVLLEAVDPKTLETYRQVCDQLDQAESQLDQATAAYAENEQAARAAASAADEYAQSAAGIGDSTETSSATVEALSESLIALKERYDEAYTAAYESLSGQYQLWDEVKKGAEITFDTILQNQQQQAQNYIAYNDNLQLIRDTASEAGVDLSSMWDDFSSGSPEAISAVSAVADEIRNSSDGGVEAMQALSDAVQATEDATATLSDTIAEQYTTMSDAFTDAVATLTESVGELDMSAEASEAAVNTMLGYVEGFQPGAEDAADLATQTGESIINNFKAALGVSSPSDITMGVGRDTILGFTIGASEQASVAADLVRVLGQMIIQSFIDGVVSMQGAANAAMASIAQSATASFQSALGSLYSAGAASIQGAIAGAESMRGALIAEYQSLAQAAASAYSSVQKISSPSKLFKYYAEMTVEGSIKGVEQMTPKLKAAYDESGQSAAEAYQRAITSEDISNTVNNYYNSIVNQPPAQVIRARAQSPRIEQPTGPTTFNLSFSFDGNATPEMEARFRMDADAIVDRVIEAINEREYDRARRRSYSYA